MYHGIHPNAHQMQLQQTYDALQNRAMEELTDEIKRLKDIIIDKDDEINKLKEITNSGTLQKKLANILEENNNLKLEIKEYNDNKQQIIEIKQELNKKNNEIYRSNEKINILNDEYNEIINKNKQLNQEIINKTEIINNNKYKDNKIVDLNQKIIKYETLINDLKKATKITDLEKEMDESNKRIITINNEKLILAQNNKHLTHIYDQVKIKYTKLLNDFEENVQTNQLKYTQKISTLTQNMNENTQKLNSEITKNTALKKQIKESQDKLTEMEQLNLKLIKGYNLEDIINDLQIEKNQKLNLQNELKQATKKLSKKEKTNVVLLNKNKLLTQTLSLSKNIGNKENMNPIHMEYSDEESTYFDHMETIDNLKHNIDTLNSKIDKLESDKYKLLMQIHEHTNANSNENDKLCISGLDITQQNKVKLFVKKLIRQSLMPISDDTDTYMSDDDNDNENERVRQLKKENNKLKQWKDTLMTKLFETGTINYNINKAEKEEDHNKEVQEQGHNMDLRDMFGINYENINDNNAAASELVENNLSEMKDMIKKHIHYVNVVLNVMNDEHIKICDIDFNILCDEDRDLMRLQHENERLNDQMEDLKGYELRHNKIENILNEKNESELIKKVETVTKENMILIVNQKKLSRKYIDIKKQQKCLFQQYQNLLQYLMESEQYLFEKVLRMQNKNDNLCIFITSVLDKISHKMVPVEQYKNIEIECKALDDTKQYLLGIIDKFESQSVQYFKCKSDHITLQNKLIEMEQHNDKKEPEIVYNAEIESDNNNNNNNEIKYKDSIQMTEKEMEIRGKKYENAMCEMKEMEQHSKMLHAQINELRGICLEQTNTISNLEKKLVHNHCDLEQYNIIQNKYEQLSVEFEKKVSQVTQLKQKTEFAVSSLQGLQSKIISTFDIEISDGDNELDKTTNKIENILKQTQDVHNKLALNEQSIKAYKDKVCGLEVQMLKDKQKYNELQMKYFNIEKSKRFLEANFNCIYSKTLHKISNKYLSEIDNLRINNEQLYEYLHAEQIKTKRIYSDMVNHKVIIESFKIKCENLNNLMTQFEVNDESNKYLKNWQNKCTNLEIKQIELVNKNESSQNEIEFLRNENKKYLVNIGSLQKKLSVLNQELQNTKHEMVEKYEWNEIQNSLIENVNSGSIETHTKSVQTMAENKNKNEITANVNENENLSKLQSKIASLQELIVGLQNESVDTDKKVSAATEGLQIMLGTAQDTIHSLQTLLTQKNESIEEYKNMINKLLNKIKEQQKKYALHINAMKLKYNNENNNIISQIQNHNNDINNNNNEWVQISQIKTTLKEKENIINELNNERNEDVVKINILNTRINEYHEIIQELNDKIIHLSDSLNAFKSKLSSKKKENFHLQKAVKTLKENMQKTTHADLKSEKCEKNNKNNNFHNDEMDYKMKKMEDEYAILRSSLKSEMDDKTLKYNEIMMQKKEIMNKNNELIRQCDKWRDNLTKKNKLIHKLQIQISKIQKDRIAMQEKHSLSIKINKKKMNNLEKSIHKLENKNKMQMDSENKQLNKMKKQLNDKLFELNKNKIKIENLKENIEKLQKENKKLLKQESENENENETELLKEMKELKLKYEKSLSEIFELKKMIELDQMKEIKKLKTENKAIKRKYDLLNNENNILNENREMTKLFEEIETKENKIIDLETKINELKFEREHLEITKNKLQKQNKNKNKLQMIESRNDPQLQNVLDSMKFIIHKLKKENESLKTENKQSQSIRITNLLKENRNLKKKLNEMNGNNKYKTNNILSVEMEQKRLEIDRITNLNRRLKKENVNLKEINDKLLKTDSFKNEEINQLRKIIENERNNLKQQINEINIIWKRKQSLTNDDLLRYKKVKKDLEKELSHKNDINNKMSSEIKALIELIEHSKNVSAENNEKMLNLEKENKELRSELSAFDVSFFNEIEDLKYRESQAQQLIIKLQSTQNNNNSNNNNDLNVLQSMTDS